MRGEEGDMVKQILVFQHTLWEGPGMLLLRAAARHRVRLLVKKVWEESIPDIKSCDALLVLGGGPNVNEEERYPFLKAEKKAIHQALAMDLPYLGFCLGHQLLADALGARVDKNFRPCVGFATGHLTACGRRHPVFTKGRGKQTLFKWHGQAVLEPVPKNIEVLMTSEGCQVEAISVTGRPHIIGVQSDNHAASAREVMEWLEHDRAWLDSLQDIHIDRDTIAREAILYESEIAENFGRFFDEFVNFL